MIDFKRVADAALASLPSLLQHWLPDGRREGNEWKALNPTRADSKVGSFSVNITSGIWADFATGDRGGDAISLYAYINGLEQGPAARELARQLAVSLDDDRPRAAPAVAPPAAEKRRSDWIPILPVPGDAPEAPKAHIKRGKPAAAWTYCDRGGALLGVIYRFRTSDGGKEIVPCVFAENVETKAREWRWLSFPEPRPLYGLQLLDDRPVLLVEGEKCADAAAAILRTEDALGPAHAMTWPGGAKAIEKVDWTPLAGRSVVLWPDCDAQTASVTQARRCDVEEGALLPEAEQPGVKAMERIAQLLEQLDPPAKVRIVKIPAPGEKPSGWDVADAVADGWTRDQVLAFMRNQREPARPKPVGTPAGAAAEDDGEGPASWKTKLWKTEFGIKDCRENVIYVLRDHPAWAGVLGADTFSKTIVVRKPSPLGQPAGTVWSQDDDMRLGLWLVEARPRMLIRSTDTLRAAVQYVAKLAAFHPVREFLEGITWDRVPRVETWLRDYLSTQDTQYSRLVGRMFLLNMVRRIYEPGCIMRSVPVLEGLQDKGKSTALRMLSQPWFSDTPFKVGDKDAYQQIQGVMLYEISELESFTRAEATAVKAFVSSTEDNFRAPYERQNEKHPRQTVFAATTNAQEYLKDWTGNTRFWPVDTGEVIRHAELAAVREQLLAEALVLYRKGERTYPTADEQRELFKPEQDRRLQVHPWMDLIDEELTHNIDFRSRETVTVREILSGIVKFDMSKINAQGAEAQTVGKVLHALGWAKVRQNNESRAWVWKRPRVELPEPVVAPALAEADDIPF